MTRLLVISDLHVGSNYGLMPKGGVEFEDPQTGHTTLLKPNKVPQQALIKCWEDMKKRVGDVDAVLINGDACDGPQRKSMGKYTWTNDLGVQAEVAAQLINEIPANEFFLTKGSEYHCMEDRPLEQVVAEKLAGVYGNDLLIEIGGARIHASHHIGTSSSAWMYRTTPLARDLLLLTLCEAPEEYGKVDFVIRSHAHYFCAVQFGSMGGCITPAWQTRTPFAVKANLISPPQIGYVLLDITDGEITMKKRLYKIPGSACKVVGYYE
jgi:hypothetical protein